MKKDEATSLLEKTFNSKFDENQYKVFIKNFFKNIDESDNFSCAGAYIPDDYKDYVKSYKRIGKFISNDDTALDIIIVNLKKESLLERNRTMQRNFIAKYLKTRGDKDFSLVAYYCDDSEDWRFSFIKKEYTSELTDKGKVKTKEAFTPAKRFSFLVGKNEPNHTAKKQLLPILQLESEPTFDFIEKAFNIESVTNEFFEKYKNLFLVLLDKIENIIKDNNKIKNEFDIKNINISSFAKKLLGQIVFLYFLQKKGWLGIEKNESGDFKQWGSGAKDFLRKLFERKYINYNNFFNDVLEPLFYEALANERENDYYHQLKCKIPFLNGGLFEPIGNYNWQEVNIPIENDFFEDVFNTFDFYNFTVREDEPLEKEVAVDPEMLGKVFENLLEVKDRKSKGAFYTPREIVHYMCQESLINYLDTEINQVDVGVIKEIIKRTDIEFFIKNGDFAKENDSAKIKGTKSYDYSISESIRKNAKIFDEKLANVKICDPAIGSGAFPVGIMTEIVKARDLLSIYISDKKDRSLYNFKRNAIQKSIYGVDLDPSAVDIAKLRLWLSLIVDEEEYKDIKPLPNLDYKIVCGNSLLNIEVTALNYKLFDDLEILKPLFFNETNNKKKKELKVKIDSLINEITNNNDEFDYKVYFSEVFHYNNGFDIVIGNPPYVKVQNIESNILKKLKFDYKLAKGKFDLYVLFIEKSFAIMGNNGQSVFIHPHRWLLADYGKTLRNFIKNIQGLNKAICFGIDQIFDTATAYTGIFFYSKNNESIKYAESDSKDIYKLNFTIKKYDSLENFSITNNNINDSILEKLRKVGLPLKYFFQGIYQGLITTGDDIFILKGKINKDYFYGYSEALKKDIKIESFLVKKILKGENIKRYTESNSDIFIFYPHKNTIEGTIPFNENEFELNYPLAYEYISNFRESLIEKKIKYKTNPKYWFSLHRSRDIDLFEQEKIITPQLQNNCNFTIDKNNLYTDAGGYILIKKISTTEHINYFLGILNSKLFWFFIQKTSTAFSSNYYYFKTKYIEPFSVPKISFEKQKPFEIIVDYILFLKAIKLEDSRRKFMPIYFEQILNGMVYELYFEEILKQSEKDILKHLTNLKDINDYKTDEEKLNVITNEFNILDDIKHPVRNNLFFMDSIEEIRIIEGRNK